MGMQTRRSLAVVPAQAGTHNHRWTKVFNDSATSIGHGVWVPACARTTARVLNRSAPQ